MLAALPWRGKACENHGLPDLTQAVAGATLKMEH